jgi:hypothetical protein
VFGQHVEVDHKEIEHIAQWKALACEKYADYLRRMEMEHRETRQRKVEENHELLEYVDRRLYMIEEKERDKKRREEEAEVARLAQRAADRAARRHAQWLLYIQGQRQEMEYEDRRSRQLREYEWECFRERIERGCMYDEERKQTFCDRYWGIDLYERRMNEEEVRLRRLYEEKVRRLGRDMMKMKAIQTVRKEAIRGLGGDLREMMKIPDERERRDKVIERLQAEEVRTKLKTRTVPGYLPPGVFEER